MREVLPPALLDRIEPAFAQATDASGPVVVEYDIDLPKGNRRFEARLVRNNNDQMLTLVRDVTEHKQAEAALRESAQRYSLATTAGAVGVWDRNLGTNDLYVDARIKALLGFEDTEIPNRVEEWKARVFSEDTKAMMTAALDSIPADTDVFETEHRMVHKDGSLRWFLSHGSVMRGADGAPYRLVGTLVDITDRKRAADLFRLALEASTTGMLMADRAGSIVLVNAHVETLFWYRREELINKPLHLLILERLHLQPEGRRGSGAEGRVSLPRGSRELTGLRKDGAAIPIEVGFSPLHTPDGEFVLFSITDTTARKRAEREREELTRDLRDLAGRLIAAQEVERGRIARDLHDDVSQQLAALSIAISGLRRQAAALPNSGDLQGEISSLQERTNALAESIRDLSHDLHPDVLRHAGLASALTDYCKGLSPSLAVDCSAQGDFESISPEAALCLYRIAQEALHNVVKHACASNAQVRLLRTGDIAEITIADNGRGFDMEMHKSGTGLGLVSITERARLAGGTVWIVTALNEGTQVRVQLPIHANRPSDSGGLSGRFATSA
jgi:PAS domain S-box-containing protein